MQILTPNTEGYDSSNDFISSDEYFAFDSNRETSKVVKTR